MSGNKEKMEGIPSAFPPDADYLQLRFPRVWPYVMALLMTVSMATAYVVWEKGEGDRLSLLARDRVARQVEIIHDRLGREVTLPMLRADAMANVIAIQGDISERDFAHAASSLVAAQPSVRNVALIRGTIITQVYPPDGNEKALGQDISKVAEQWPLVEKSMLQHVAVLQGPVTLLQGGKGIIARVPVYLRESANQGGRFFGFVNVALGFERLLSEAGVEDSSQDIMVAIRGQDGEGDQGHSIYGDDALFGKKPVLRTLTLPFGIWQIAAIPRQGWDQARSVPVPVRLMGWGGVFLSGVASFGLVIFLHRHARALARMQSSQRRFSALFRRSQAVMLLIDPLSRTVVDANESALRFYGYPLGKLCGMPVSEINVLPSEEIAAEMERARQEKRWHFYFRHRLASGEIRDVEVHSGPVPLDDGEYLYSIIHDVTDRRRLEEALNSERLSLHNIVWGTGVGTWEWNIQTGEARFNQRWAEMLGYALDELHPMTVDVWRRLVHPDDLAGAEALLARHLSGQADFFEHEVRMHHRDGRWIWVLARGRLVSRGASGNPAWLAGIHLDISHRKEIETALQASQAHLEVIVDIVPVGIAITDDSGQPVESNRAFRQIFGGNGRGGVDGLAWAQDRGVFADILRTGERGKAEGGVVRVAEADGDRWLMVRAASPNLPGHGLVLACTDITKQKMAEHALAESEERFSLAMEGVSDGIWDWDVRSGRLFLSPQWKRQLGYASDELDDSFDTIEALCHPDDWPRLRDELGSYLHGDQAHFLMEFRLRHRDESYHWVMMRGAALRDSDGIPYRMAGSQSDISGRKAGEERLALQREELARSNAELEQFAYAASHDLRQPLRMINSFAQLLGRRLGSMLDDDGREMMGFITEGATRMDNMLVALLEYSRVGRMGEPMTDLECGQVVGDAVLFLTPVIDEAQAQLHLPTQWPHVWGSRNELTRLFQNLIGNAVKFRAPGQHPEIRLEVEEQEEQLRFSVADNGIGIAPDQGGRLFKVFQRLQAQGKYEGTGVGLAVCRKIVERHGGHIWVESDGDGKGSCFVFTLPKPSLSRDRDVRENGDGQSQGDGKIQGDGRA